MPPPRWRVQEELHFLEAKVQRLGAEAIHQLGQAVAALAGPADHDVIIAGDDEVDRRYLEVERSVLQLFALQTPVASDLRLLTALLHVGLHLERVGDMAVNIAKLTRLVVGRPPDLVVQRQLQQMGTLALELVATAMDALARRDLDLARSLPSMDEPIDRRNRAMLDQVLAAGADRRVLGWAVPMYVVARELERIGDHAVDIGEQVAFLVTGEFHEFSDATRRQLPHPQPE
jgi:phosphate transport system protein